MSPTSIDRRAVLAGAATLPALAVLASAGSDLDPAAAAEPHPDAELLELEHRFLELRSEEDRLEAEQERLRHTSEKRTPTMPRELRVRRSDERMDFHFHGNDGFIDGGDIDALRGRKMMRHVMREQKPADLLPEAVALYRKIHGRLPMECVGYEPWPAKQRRADEIVAAYDRWIAASCAIDEELGLPAIDAQIESVTMQIKSVVTRTAGIQAATIDGLRAKARMAYWGHHADLEQMSIASSIVNDLLSVTGV